MNCHRALLFILWFSLLGCQWGGKSQPSILIIAVESLNFEKVNCHQSQHGLQGFQTLCDEAIRFTHHYTSSTMSQAALASLLTARYPIEHGVWHNGKQYLSSKFETVAEVAVRSGYRTSFFSGGPPIFKKSGLGQGFEKFDDYIQVKLNAFYRPVMVNFQRFYKWMTTEVGNQPFFSVIYVPDLQFASETTQTDAGVVRPREYMSQIHELGESLETLIKLMKDYRVWHNTHVFLVGLNGYSLEIRPNEMDPSNLYSEVVQTPLFIKPSQKLRDQGINWKIDRNVSIVDLGATLYELLGAEVESPQNRDLEVTSLISVMDRPDVNWNSQRYILIESAFSQWRRLAGSRFSIRSGYYSLIYDNDVKLFNTLIDRNEINPISQKDVLWKSIFHPIEKYLREKGVSRWGGPDPIFINKVKLANLIWGLQKKDERIVTQELEYLLKKNQYDSELVSWKAELAINKQDWNLLLNAGKQARNKYWIYLAKKKLGQPVSLPNRGCYQFFAKSPKDNSSYRQCEDKLFLQLIAFKYTTNQEKKTQIFERFIRDYYNYRLVKKAHIENLKAALRWDINTDFQMGPNLTEVYLSLSKNKALAEKIEKRLLKL